ncbi:hypothetical protein BGZ82_000460 [Podila clonocystis]|nr:hypothetical protein BGZ82_000460 [Podila clonocystis]
MPMVVDTEKPQELTSLEIASYGPNLKDVIQEADVYKLKFIPHPTTIERAIRTIKMALQEPPLFHLDRVAVRR